MNSNKPLSSSRVFEHEAMNTTFQLRLLEADELSAKSVAKEAFYQIDQIEAQLSRFIENSEVSRINCMEAGETLYLSESTHGCLLVALEAAVRTHGLFDITIGSRIEHRKEGGAGPTPDVCGRLVIHPDVPAVTCEEAGRMIDLGGIGKGFALDHLRRLLDEWQVDGALLTAGASSMVAYGEQAWPVDLTGENDRMRIQLAGRSLSASGTHIQGSHIVHPWGDDAMPAEPCARVWVVASTAAWAEVWSTAIMLVDVEEIDELLDGVTEVDEVYIDRGGRMQRVFPDAG